MFSVTSRTRSTRNLDIYYDILLLGVFDFLKYNTYTDKNVLPIKHECLTDEIEKETHCTVNS
jgi:hypothetical protein